MLKLANEIASLGNEVRVGVIAKMDQVDWPDYYGDLSRIGLTAIAPVRAWPRRIARLLDTLRLAVLHRKQIRQFQPDFVYARLVMLELLLVPRFQKIVIEMHSLGPLADGSIRRTIMRTLLFLKQVDLIITTTSAMKVELERILPDRTIRVVYLSASFPESVSRELLREFRLSNFKGLNFSFHAGFTGNLDQSGLRGIGLLLRIAEAMPSVMFHIVGGAPDDVIFWRKQLEINHPPLENIYFYGRRSYEEIPLFLSNFDVLLSPLQYVPTKAAPLGANMSPLKISQYMASGKPIVASDLPAHRELLTDRSNALLVDAADVKSWKSAIELLSEDSDLARKLSNEARSFYLSRLTPRQRVESIVSGLQLRAV